MEANDSKAMKKPQTRPALGRGLSALISTQPVAVEVNAPLVPVVHAQVPANASDRISTEESREGGVRFLPLGALVANPTQPRLHFSEQEIAELSESIRQKGVLQPILVRPSAVADTFEIVAGERRYRAATRAGLTQMPVIIRTLSDRETLEVAIVENVQRQNLNPMEEAKGYQRLMDEFSLSSQEVAEKVGKDRATVSNVVRLMKLPVHVQVLVAEGQISVGHAKAILTVKEPAVQLSLAQKVLDEGLSVRALEAIVSRSVVLEPLKTRSQGSSSSVAPKSELDVPHPDLEERLRNVLGTKVTIRKSKQGGAVEVHFYSDSELDRLIDMLVSIEGK